MKFSLPRPLNSKHLRAANSRTLLLWSLKFGAVFVIFLIFFFPIQKETSVTLANIHALKGEITDLKQISVNLLTEAELKETE